MNERILVADHLFAETLPEQWSSVLDALQQLYDLKRDKKTSFEDRSAVAQQVYAQLLQESALLVEPTPHEVEVGSEHFRDWFSEAVFLWMRLAETGSPPILETTDTKTLDDFPLDLPLDPAARTKMRQALKVAFDFHPDEMTEIAHRIDHITSNLTLKRAIADVLAERCRESDGPSPEDCVALMKAIYGPLPWRSGDVHLVITATTIFFCIRRDNGKLDEPDWDERPEDERAAIAKFLVDLKAANVAETKRFPAFGLFDTSVIDAALIEDVRARLEKRGKTVSAAVVIATLATMCSVLRTDEVEMYIVHDTWGHCWQEALSEFEWEFELLPRVSQPLGPEDGPTIGGDASPTLGSAFVPKDGRTELDEERWMQFVEADLRGCLQLGLSAAVAEMLADFMEAKYARACPDSAMPTSSLIPVAGLKLDLSFMDLRRQVVRVKHRYEDLHDDEEKRAALAQRLAEAGWPQEGLREAVDRGVALAWERFGPRLMMGLAAKPVEGAPDGVVSTVYRRLVLKLLLLVAELERSLDGLGAQVDPPWMDPGTCPDLFVLCAAHFYERNRQRKFWKLDQVLRSELPVAMVRLRSALRS